jgi:hypothetical protein
MGRSCYIKSRFLVRECILLKVVDKNIRSQIARLLVAACRENQRPAGFLCAFIFMADRSPLPLVVRSGREKQRVEITTSSGSFGDVMPPALVGRGAVLREKPQSAVANLLQLLSYDYNRRDMLINAVTLAMVVAAFAVATASGTLLLGTFFWLPVAVLIASLQCIASLLSQQQGFSLVWCCLSGLMLYEEARWRVFSGASVGASVVAIAAAVAVGLSLCYYLIEEVALDPWSDLSGLKGVRWAFMTCWDRIGTTMMHTASGGLGVALGGLADAAPGREATFWALLGLAAAATAVGLPCVLRHHHRLRVGCSASSIQPDAPTPTLSADELAIASLQSHLLRTREELAYLSSGVGRQASRDKLLAEGSASEAAEGTSSASVGDDAAGSGAAIESPAAADVALDDRIEALRRREAQLLERIAERVKGCSAG